MVVDSEHSGVGILTERDILDSVGAGQDPDIELAAAHRTGDVVFAAPEWTLQQAAEMTVVENLQRQDLNCMEQAAAFSKLSQDFKLTQEQIGQRVGISRESVSNYMRLLRLPAFLRQGESGPNGWSDQDLRDGFQLTGMFLLRHVLEPRGQGHSDARDGFINAVTKHRARISSVL